MLGEYKHQTHEKVISINSPEKVKIKTIVRFHMRMITDKNRWGSFIIEEAWKPHTLLVAVENAVLTWKTLKLFNKLLEIRLPYGQKFYI